MIYNRAFNKEWFLKHQDKLVRLLRFKFFRRALRIDTNAPIIQILPNSYTIYDGYKNGEYQFKTQFRIHNKYSKWIYNSFKYIWWSMHIWDIFADVAIPKLSFGFSTLGPLYPDADPETSTVDGQIVYQGTNVTWATIHDAADGTSASDSATFANMALISSGTTSNRYSNLYRGMTLFDTSALPDAATISAAVLQMWGRAKANGLGTPSVNVYSANPASNTALAAADYDQIGTTAYATAISYASWSDTDTAYNSFNFNATGIAAISKTGISKFGIREATFDVANSAPTWASEQESGFRSRWAEDTGGDKDPAFTVTYSVSSLKTIQGLAVASVKLVQALAIASMKDKQGLA